MPNIDKIRYGSTVCYGCQICLNVSLTPELEQLVDKKVGCGLYQTAVREALRL